MNKMLTALAIAAAALLVASPAAATNDEPPPTSEAPPSSVEECVPEGTEIVDVETGDTYVYGTPTEFGFDTCGNPIPDICVDWGDHVSRLWNPERPCGVTETTEPVEATVPAVEPEPVTPPAPSEPQSPMTLPETGSETTWIAIAAALCVILGGGAVLAVRRW